MPIRVIFEEPFVCCDCAGEFGDTIHMDKIEAASIARVKVWCTRCNNKREKKRRKEKRYQKLLSKLVKDENFKAYFTEDL